MRGPGRVARGVLTDPSHLLSFRFDGRSLQGYAGDTLASALLANGIALVGRSFKYHRPRGILTAGAEEPCALVDIVGVNGREPNRLATTLPLQPGLDAFSQNRWPSLRVDAGAINDLLSRFLPAGFYYKTFMYPGWAWERVYEPLIRRAAGLGRLQPAVVGHTVPEETVHDHADVLVVGAGAAGLAAAARLRSTGLRVMLLEQDSVVGGALLLDDRWTAWRDRTLAAIGACSTVRTLTHTAVIGAYGHGVFGALETLSAGRERLRVIRAKRVVLATGALERLIAFPGNDRPGVMLAGAALSYLRRYGVAVGRHPVLFVNNDEAYATAFAMHAAGIQGIAVVDVRRQSFAADRARALGLVVYAGAVVVHVAGRKGVTGVTVRDIHGSKRRTMAADCLLMSGGHSPATSLASQMGGELLWQESLAAYRAQLEPDLGQTPGAAGGVTGLAAAAQDGERAADAIAGSLLTLGALTPVTEDRPSDPQVTPLEPLWEVSAPGKAFVDLQNDVTTADVRLAVREGYEHVEHMKRYTTHGMATDQGRIGGLVGSAVLAAARGLPVSDVGQSKPRPFAQPIPFAALAGGEVGEHFKPKRRLPLHDWHESAGATFALTGLWLRPLVYSRQPGWEPVMQEASRVRSGVGITDVSTLGKIDVRGPDAARFLDFVYANTFSTLPIGRARYGIMLREDGMLLDDGTTSRLAASHFLITTTTANATAVLEHLEFHLQASCPYFDVTLTDVADHWAQFALAGPRARKVLAQVVAGLDVSNAAFPFMAAAAATIAGIAGRLFRISFSGELAFELAVPARYAQDTWLALLAAGKEDGIAPYGLDALNTLRIEKGHVTGAELNGNTSADDLGFGRLLKQRGDFIGRALSQRPGLLAPDRQQLVGVRALDRSRRLRNGAQLVLPTSPTASLGFVTSSTPSTYEGAWVGLALLAGGRERLGQRMVATSPIHTEDAEVEIVSPHHLDPENLRVRT